MVRSSRLTLALLFITITLVSLTGCTGLKSKSPIATSEPTRTLTPTIRFVRVRQMEQVLAIACGMGTYEDTVG